MQTLLFSRESYFFTPFDITFRCRSKKLIFPRDFMVEMKNFLWPNELFGMVVKHSLAKRQQKKIKLTMNPEKVFQ